MVSEIDPLLRLQNVLSLIPISRSAWYAGVKSGIYPSPVKIGPRIAAWRQSDVQKVLNQLVAKEVA